MGLQGALLSGFGTIEESRTGEAPLPDRAARPGHPWARQRGHPFPALFTSYPIPTDPAPRGSLAWAQAKGA